MKHWQVVIDSNVVLSAMRSRRGASFRLLYLVGKGDFDIHLSVPLVLEYEHVAKRSKWPGKPAWSVLADILDYLCHVGKKPKIHFLWRPRARDPKDDMVLEVAVAGSCNAVITYNKRDFAEAASFGLQVLNPQEFLRELGELP
jgi:putative PIN family toxin of toxin-antitoxin system